MTDTADPLGGSYYVEALTSEIENRAGEILDQVEHLGGAVGALDMGVPQRWIAEEAYAEARRLADGSAVKVGVNRHVDEEHETSIEAFHLSPDVGARQMVRLEHARRGRDAAAVAAGLEAVRRSAATDTNIMPPLIEAAAAGATLGEMSDVLRAEFGEFEEPALW